MTVLTTTKTDSSTSLYRVICVCERCGFVELRYYDLDDITVASKSYARQKTPINVAINSAVTASGIQMDCLLYVCSRCGDYPFVCVKNFEERRGFAKRCEKCTRRYLCAAS